MTKWLGVHNWLRQPLIHWCSFNFISVVHSGYLCYPGAWLVWRFGLAVKWVGKEVKLVTIIVSGHLQKQLQCLKLCEYLCVCVYAYCIKMKLFRDSTRNFDGADLRLLGWMVFCNFDRRHFDRRHVVMGFCSCLVLTRLSSYCKDEVLLCSMCSLMTLNLI